MSRVNLQNALTVCHVSMGPEEMDELTRHCSITATGDGVLLVDVDALENSSSKVAKEVMSCLPDGFGGLVYITE